MTAARTGATHRGSPLGLVSFASGVFLLVAGIATQALGPAIIGTTLAPPASSSA